ncbi:MAG: hypothetical protein IKA41_01615 [Bacteroidaceae bacterium]|nr:hypothetical protein [Bacteroidaceae bacterium]
MKMKANVNYELVFTTQNKDGEDCTGVYTLRSIDGPVEDILSAVKAAAADFAKTPKGKRVIGNEILTWKRFLDCAPNFICAKRGFIKVSPDVPPEVHQIDLGEPLLSKDADELHPFACPFCGSTNTMSDYYDGEAKAEMRDCLDCHRSYIVWDNDDGEPESITDTLGNKFPLIANLIKSAREAERLLMNGDEEVEIGVNTGKIAIWAYSPSRGDSRHVLDMLNIGDVNHDELVAALDNEGIAYVL